MAQPKKRRAIGNKAYERYLRNNRKVLEDAFSAEDVDDFTPASGSALDKKVASENSKLAGKNKNTKAYLDRNDIKMDDSHRKRMPLTPGDYTKRIGNRKTNKGEDPLSTRSKDSEYVYDDFKVDDSGINPYHNSQSEREKEYLGNRKPQRKAGESDRDYDKRLQKFYEDPSHTDGWDDYVKHHTSSYTMDRFDRRHSNDPEYQARKAAQEQNRQAASRKGTRTNEVQYPNLNKKQIGSSGGHSFAPEEGGGSSGGHGFAPASTKPESKRVLTPGDYTRNIGNQKSQKSGALTPGDYTKQIGNGNRSTSGGGTARSKSAASMRNNAIPAGYATERDVSPEGKWVLNRGRNYATINGEKYGEAVGVASSAKGERTTNNSRQVLEDGFRGRQKKEEKKQAGFRGIRP